MKYRVKNATTVSTSWDQLNDIANSVLAQINPRVGEIFEGTAGVDNNGNRIVCGNKTVLGVTYQFCLARTNVEPVIFGIPVNAVTLMGAGLMAVLLFKIIKKK